MNHLCSHNIELGLNKINMNLKKKIISFSETLYNVLLFL